MFQWNSRLRNKGFWTSFFALLLVVVQQIATRYGYSFDTQLYNDIITLALFTLTGLGIINNPTTDSVWWTDDYEKEES